MDGKVKTKGRVIAAPRLGLRAAKDDLAKAGDPEGVAACERALKRAERLEEHGLDQQRAA